jgi:hypothetical protein
MQKDDLVYVGHMLVRVVAPDGKALLTKKGMRFGGASPASGQKNSNRASPTT